jgi:hypothetical protein
MLRFLFNIGFANIRGCLHWLAYNEGETHQKSHLIESNIIENRVADMTTHIKRLEYLMITVSNSLRTINQTCTHVMSRACVTRRAIQASVQTQ